MLRRLRGGARGRARGAGAGALLADEPGAADRRGARSLPDDGEAMNGASAEDTKRLAAQANNHAWDLAEAVTRTPEQDEDMLQAAHAAMYCWKRVGDAGHRA